MRWLELSLIITYSLTTILFICGNPAILYPLMWHHLSEVAFIFLLGYWFHGYAAKKGKKLSLEKLFGAWLGLNLFTTLCLFMLIPQAQIFSGTFFAVSVITCPLLVGFWLAARRKTK